MAAAPPLHLSAGQLDEFDRTGLCWLPSVFSDIELAVLRNALPELLARPGPEAVREPTAATAGNDGGEADAPPAAAAAAAAVRLVYGCHVFSAVRLFDWQLPSPRDTTCAPSLPSVSRWEISCGRRPMARWPGTRGC